MSNQSSKTPIVKQTLDVSRHQTSDKLYSKCKIEPSKRITGSDDEYDYENDYLVTPKLNIDPKLSVALSPSTIK